MQSAYSDVCVCVYSVYGHNLRILQLEYGFAEADCVRFSPQWQCFTSDVFYFTHTSCLISMCRLEEAESTIVLHCTCTFPQFDCGSRNFRQKKKKQRTGKKSSTCLNQDRTLHTNGIARVLTVFKTLDLFFQK